MTQREPNSQIPERAFLLHGDKHAQIQPDDELLFNLENGTLEFLRDGVNIQFVYNPGMSAWTHIPMPDLEDPERRGKIVQVLTHISHLPLKRIEEPDPRLERYRWTSA